MGGFQIISIFEPHEKSETYKQSLPAAYHADVGDVALPFCVESGIPS